MSYYWSNANLWTAKDRRVSLKVIFKDRKWTSARLQISVKSVPYSISRLARYRFYGWLVLRSKRHNGLLLVSIERLELLFQAVDRVFGRVGDIPDAFSKPIFQHVSRRVAVRLHPFGNESKKSGNRVVHHESYSLAENLIVVAHEHSYH